MFSPSLFLSIDSTSAADCFAAATISIPPALLDPIADEFAGQGQIPKDLVFRRLAQSPGGSSAAVSEAGLAELESIDLAGNPDYVIAMDNWPLMLRIQFRHFRSSLRALPIVVWLWRNFTVIRRHASLPAWDDAFQVMRRNCETDWAQRFPQYVVSEWIGHDITVSATHYLRVPEELFLKAAELLSPEADAVLPQSATKNATKAPVAF